MVAENHTWGGRDGGQRRISLFLHPALGTLHVMEEGAPLLKPATMAKLGREGDNGTCSPATVTGSSPQHTAQQATYSLQWR